MRYFRKRRRSLTRRETLKRNRKIVALCIAFLCVFSVGYAAFQSTLSLNVTGVVKRKPTYINGPISDLIETKVTTGSGLYDNGDDTYTYKGNNPYNYISFNNELWRIVSISSLGQLKIVKDDKLDENMVFDSANVRTSGYCANAVSGCNAWSDETSYTNGDITGEVSAPAQLNSYLNGTYYNNLSDKEIIVEKDFNIGPSNNEDSFTSSSNVGLLTESEYTAAGANSYLKKSYEYFLLTPAASSSSDIKVAGASVVTSSANSSKGIMPVVNLTCDINITGKGLKNDPFIISSGDGTCSNIPAPSTPIYYLFHTDKKNIGGTLDTSSLTKNEWPSGRNVAIKYVVSGSTITEAWTCTKFSFIADPVCVRGGTRSNNFYTSNKNYLLGLSSTFSGQGGSCTESANDLHCYAGDFHVRSRKDGSVYSGDDSLNQSCNFDSYGSYCSE